DPFGRVMHLGLGCWLRATGERAAAVAGEQGSSLTSAGKPSGPSEIEDLAGCTEDSLNQRTVGRDSKRLVHTQLAAVVGGGGADSAFQIVQIDGDDERAG